jgi:hypothetical protein
MKRFYLVFLILLLSACSNTAGSDNGQIQIEDSPSLSEDSEVVDESDYIDEDQNKNESGETLPNEDESDSDETEEDEPKNDIIENEDVQNSVGETELETDIEDEPFLTKEELDQLNNVRLPLQSCQLRQQTQVGHHDVFGFPLRTIIPNKGRLDVAVVTVDFDDYPGDPALITQLASDLPLMAPWSEFFSGGNMQYEVHFSNQWVRAPKNAEWYRSRDGHISEGYQGQDQRILPRLQTQEESVNQLIAASDALIDWSIIDVVIFIFPVESFAEQTNLYMHMGTFQSPSKGTVSFPVWGENFQEISQFRNPITYWDWSVHEVLHWQGLVGHGPINGSDYSIMANQYASTSGLHSWEAFLLDWWGEDDFTCIDPHSIEEPIKFVFDSIDELGAAPGNKSLMLPFNESEILVIEYRTQGEWSTLEDIFQGILIYYINVNGEYVRCDRCDQLEIELLNFWRFLRSDTILECREGFLPHCGFPSIVQKPGFKLSFEDIQFEIIEENVIVISRTEQ